MTQYEFQGKNTGEAIEDACRQLKLAKEEMDIEIIEPGFAGIFGLVGGKKAKIKVTIADNEPEVDSNSQIGEILNPAIKTNGLDVARDALEQILALIPMEETTVSAEKLNGTISLKIDGDKSGLLIGRKGRTLDALQYIVNKIVNKALEKKSQVIIDSENYRERREEFLVQMAEKLGDKVKKTKRSMATNLLNPYDRRIVHLALKEDIKLDTRSRGEGIYKKVIIKLKKL